MNTITGMIPRTLQSIVKQKLHKGKAIIISGPRQVGKTTLINAVLEGKEFLFLNSDDHHTNTSIPIPTALPHREGVIG